LVHFNVTASPTAAWIWRQLMEATPWGRQPSHLLHDRDAVYGHDIDARLAKVGIAGVRTPVRAPRANAVAERVVRTFRAECLDHMIVMSERHLHAVLTEFIGYYNHERPHRTLALQMPVPGSAYRRGRSFRGRFSAGFTTSMPERRELGSHFAALHQRGRTWPPAASCMSPRCS
jgi:transposase InsO family protein